VLYVDADYPFCDTPTAFSLITASWISKVMVVMMLLIVNLLSN